MYWPMIVNRLMFRPDADRMLEELDHLFGTWPTRNSGVAQFPRLNAWASNDGLMVSFEVPGLDPATLDVAVQDNKLTVAGEVPARTAGQDEIYHRSERFAGKFSREVALPFRVAAEKVKAEYRRGVLLVQLPRMDEDKPRRISVVAK